MAAAKKKTPRKLPGMKMFWDLAQRKLEPRLVCIPETPDGHKYACKVLNSAGGLDIYEGKTPTLAVANAHAATRPGKTPDPLKEHEFKGARDRDCKICKLPHIDPIHHHAPKPMQGDCTSIGHHFISGACKYCGAKLQDLLQKETIVCGTTSPPPGSTPKKAILQITTEIEPPNSEDDTEYFWSEIRDTLQRIRESGTVLKATLTVPAHEINLS